MSDKSGRATTGHWEPGPVIDWLLGEGRHLARLDDLTRQLGTTLLAAGAPLSRLRLSMRTLHPLVTAVSSVWERDSASTQSIVTPHGLEVRSGYIGSPLEIITRTEAPFRKRLDEDLSDDDHTVLHDLKASGGTDYFGLPLFLSDGGTSNMVYMSDREGGFSDSDIEGFTKIASVLAPIAEVYKSKSVSLAVAEAYLGPRTGQRVLSGQITRGDIETVEAAIFVSDIRDWTGLNARLPAGETLALANRYFEIVATAIEGYGGEILKFMGDGVLAVFAMDPENADASAVCSQALAAAHQALAGARAAQPPLDLDFGIGLHFGQVRYGNIGSETRLDFTVLGQAVNIAARIEGLCRQLDRPVLFSKAFADLLSGPSTLVATESLKGLDAKAGIYTTPEQTDEGR